MKKFSQKDIKKTHAGISRIKAMLQIAFKSVDKLIDFTIDDYDHHDINGIKDNLRSAIILLESLNKNLNDGNLCYDAKEINKISHAAFINDLIEDFEVNHLAKKDTSNSDSICDFGPQDGGSSNE